MGLLGKIFGFAARVWEALSSAAKRRAELRKAKRIGRKAIGVHHELEEEQKPKREVESSEGEAAKQEEEFEENEELEDEFEDEKDFEQEPQPEKQPQQSK